MLELDYKEEPLKGFPIIWNSCRINLFGLFLRRMLLLYCLEISKYFSFEIIHLTKTD